MVLKSSYEVVLPNSLKEFLARGKKILKVGADDWEINIGQKSSFISSAIPPGALIFGFNGIGDCLFLRAIEEKQKEQNRKVYVYWHEEDKFELLNHNIDELLSMQAAISRDHSKIYYHGGEIEVMLGDEVSAKDFLFRKLGRIVYIPGLSPINREFEHNGMAWVGIRFAGGAVGGTFVYPEKLWLKKSVRFLRRLNTAFEQISEEDFEK